MTLHHTDETPCKLCSNKLLNVHPELINWFQKLTHAFPSVHISDGFRDEFQQNLCVERKTSKVKWPNSKHNAMDSNGNPCSRALDIFVLDMDGVARWEKNFFRRVYVWSNDFCYPIDWGHVVNFKGDYPHFQLKPKIKQP